MSAASSSKSRPKAAPSDKVFVGGSPADRKVFVEDVIECIRQKGPKTLLIPISVFSEFVKKQPPLSPANLFRKQYGNLEHVFNHEKLDSVFLLDNSVIRLRPLSSLQGARDTGLISEELLAKCAEMHRSKRVHDLTTLRNTDRNECAVCGQPYPVLANTNGACGGSGQNHKPAFDWERSEDVLQCEIKQ